jgi:glycine/D-amino acid oxidase-like deaminating enzyme
MFKSTVDYLIVGLGLAGSALAIQLLRAGKKIAVIDNANKNRSSNVAAGLFNPVTGKKMMKTWKADTLFPYLSRFYRDAEEVTREKFFYPMPVYRPFISVEEQNEWMGRSNDPNYKDLVDRIYTSQAFENIVNPFGGLLLANCGYLNTTGFMDAVRSLVSKQQIYVQGNFMYSELNVTEQNVEYQGITAAKIVFCEGYEANKNPWFKYLQLRGLKGEVLLIKSEWPKQVIINRGVYIVPSTCQFEYRVGATYNFTDLSAGITTEARKELEEKMNALIDFSYRIEGQEWGIRPTTVDRRPILGEHPEIKNLWIFNGMGTKGVSLAPYFSEVLIRCMEKGTPLEKDINVTRFKLLY